MKIFLAASVACLVLWGHGRCEEADGLAMTELLEAAHRALQDSKQEVKNSEADFCDVICEDEDENEREACVTWCELELAYAVKLRDSSGSSKRGIRVRWPAPRIRVPAPNVRFQK